LPGWVFAARVLAAVCVVRDRRAFDRDGRVRWQGLWLGKENALQQAIAQAAA